MSRNGLRNLNSKANRAVSVSAYSCRDQFHPAIGGRWTSAFPARLARRTICAMPSSRPRGVLRSRLVARSRSMTPATIRFQGSLNSKAAISRSLLQVSMGWFVFRNFPLLAIPQIWRAPMLTQQRAPWLRPYPPPIQTSRLMHRQISLAPVRQGTSRQRPNSPRSPQVRIYLSRSNGSPSCVERAYSTEQEFEAKKTDLLNRL